MCISDTFYFKDIRPGLWCCCVSIYTRADKSPCCWAPSPTDRSTCLSSIICCSSLNILALYIDAARCAQHMGPPSINFFVAIQIKEFTYSFAVARTKRKSQSRIRCWDVCIIWWWWNSEIIGKVVYDGFSFLILWKKYSRWQVYSKSINHVPPLIFLLFPHHFWTGPIFVRFSFLLSQSKDQQLLLLVVLRWWQQEGTEIVASFF